MKSNAWKKSLSVVATAGLLASLLTGCASSGEEAAKEDKGAEQNTGKAKVVVWSHWGDKELEALKSVAQEWATKTGNEVTVQVDKTEFQQYATTARSGKGPDVMFGIPHDNLGTFEKAGLLDPVPSGTLNESEVEGVAFKGVTIGGKQVAFPFSMETYGLFYNIDKIKTAPKTWDEFLKAAKDNGFMYDINNFYFSYAFLSGSGAYVFKDKGGTLDVNDIGLGGDGGTKGYALLQDMVQKEKFMPADVTGDIAKGKFQAKQTGLYISGPWDTAPFKTANVPFDVAPLPTLPGGIQPKTFVGVQTAFVSSKSQNKQAAWDLIKYLSENGSKKFLEVGNRIPVKKSLLADVSFKENKLASTFATIAASGEPMPNIPEMAQVWTPAGNNLKLLTQGKIDPAKAANDIVTQIKQGIATAK